jgi:hypothetical protein
MRRAFAVAVALAVAATGCDKKEGAGVLETLASSDGTYLRLAADASGVYWTSDNGPGQSKILTVGLDGGDITELASAENGPRAIALDLDNVYWADIGDETAAIKKVSHVGGQPTVMASNQKRPYAIAVAGTDLVWTDTAAGSVLRSPIAGGDTVSMVLQQPAPEGIASDSTKVNWVNSGGGTIEELDLLTGAAQTQIATAQSGAHDLAMDVATGGLYWATAGETGGIVRFGPNAEAGDAGSVTTIVADRKVGAGGAVSVAPDGVYWIDVEGNEFTVMKAALTGGVGQALATGSADAVFDLFATLEAVYVLTSDGQRGSVMKIAK